MCHIRSSREAPGHSREVESPRARRGPHHVLGNTGSLPSEEGTPCSVLTTFWPCLSALDCLVCLETGLDCLVWQSSWPSARSRKPSRAPRAAPPPRQSRSAFLRCRICLARRPQKGCLKLQNPLSWFKTSFWRGWRIVRIVGVGGTCHRGCLGCNGPRRAFAVKVEGKRLPVSPFSGFDL